MTLKSKKESSFLMPLNLRTKSASRFCMFSKVRSDVQMSGASPVYLNVYDLTPMNGYIYWAGLGIFHSGVEGITYFLIVAYRSHALHASLKELLPDYGNMHPTRVME